MNGARQVGGDAFASLGISAGRFAGSSPPSGMNALRQPSNEPPFSPPPRGYGPPIGGSPPLRATPSIGATPSIRPTPSIGTTPSMGGSPDLAKAMSQSPGVAHAGKVTAEKRRRQQELEMLTHPELFGLPLEAVDWTGWRVDIAKVLKSSPFRGTVAGLIVLNLIVVVVETNAVARREEPQAWMEVFNYSVLFFYVAEVAARLLVFQWGFFSDQWNSFDLVLVVLDVVANIAGNLVALPSITFLRVFRLTPMLCSFNVLFWFPELHLMVTSLISAMRSIFWGTCLISVILVVCSIVAVVYIHPINEEIHAGSDIYAHCERCPRAYESVQASFLTFMQVLITGDSWGATAVPIIEYRPWTMLYFITVVSTVQLGLLNLIMAVTVDRAQAARDNTNKEVAHLEAVHRQELQLKMKQIFRAIDMDGSGSLTYPEIMKGMEHEDFQEAMAALDIYENDMAMMFKLIDEDNSGEIQYEEFADQLDKLKQNDSHTIITFLRFYVADLNRTIHDSMKVVQNELLAELREVHSFLARGPPALEAKYAAGMPQPRGGYGQAAGRYGANTTLGTPMEYLKKELDRLASANEHIHRDQVSLLLRLAEAQERGPAPGEAALGAPHGRGSKQVDTRPDGQEQGLCCAVDSVGAGRRVIQAGLPPRWTEQSRM